VCFLKAIVLKAKLLASDCCGFRFSDVFFSKTERCINVAEQTVVESSALYVITNFFVDNAYKTLNIFTKSFNDLSYINQLFVITYFYATIFLLIALIIVLVFFFFARRRN
jgi:hypothetical protein